MARERAAAVLPPVGSEIKTREVVQCIPLIRLKDIRPAILLKFKWPGGNSIKISRPGKLILSKRKGLLKIVSEKRFSGKTYFYTIGPNSLVIPTEAMYGNNAQI